MLEGELSAQLKPRMQSARESRAKPEIEWMEGSGEGRGLPSEGGLGRGLGKAPPQKNFENSYLKPCILVYI